MDKVSVRIQRKDYSYPVLVCNSATTKELRPVFNKLGLIELGSKKQSVQRKALIVIDKGFAKLRQDFITSLKDLYPDNRCHIYEVESSEEIKNFKMAETILGEMVKAGLNRTDLCIAVGGGMIGDLAGFVSSLYYRGIDIVHIPTTLLAMVDSSVGGKTAVNHDAGKNLIGTFYQPKAVIEILSFVETLPFNDFLSGLGEVFKYAVGFDAKLFQYLDKNAAKIVNRDPKVLKEIILKSIAIKAKVVGLDEKEQGVTELKGAKQNKSADRRLLNLGHTIGHGIEKAYGLPHGVAIAIGVTIATNFSSKVNFCTHQCYTKVIELARKLRLKTDQDFQWEKEKVFAFVKKDKKFAGDKVHFVCIKGIGQALVRPTMMSEFEELLGR